MRPIIAAGYTKDQERRSSTEIPPAPNRGESPGGSVRVNSPSVCFRKRSSFFSRDAEEKTNAEKSGKEQIAEQNALLKSINDQLNVIKQQVERNASTNAALLVLMTHVLKGENQENGGAGEGDLTPPPPQDVPVPDGNGVAGGDSDTKSLSSDMDIFDKRSEHC